MAEKTKTVRTAAPKSASVSKPKRNTRQTAGNDVSAELIGPNGDPSGTVSLPKTLFAAPVNQQVLVQAIHIYRFNQREWSAHAKTRGEVAGSTRKIYRQKGTGRARHGAVRAPIFVHGGIAHGPKSGVRRRTLPKKMKRIALRSALTTQFQEGAIRFVDRIPEQQWRTGEFQSFFENLDIKKNTLFVVPNDSGNIRRNTRNIPYIESARSADLNAYTVMRFGRIVFCREAIVDIGPEDKSSL